MAVYVDDMNLPADVPNGNRTVGGKWSHLFADTEAELIAFARKIGLKPEWIQREGTHRVHFDVTAGKRQQAIAEGATALTMHEADVFFLSQARKERAAAHARRAEAEARPQRHSWSVDGKTLGNVKICGRDGCGMVAERRAHPTEKRWLTIYAKDGRRIVSERVPRCGSELPEGGSAEEMAHLAEAADRQAAVAYKRGDLDRAFRLLTDARALDPGRTELWDSHEERIRDAAKHRQAQAPRERPAMDSPEVQAEIQKIHEWNAGLPQGFCRRSMCPEHGEKAKAQRQADMFREREGAA
jgi:hypothetical protein